MRLLPEWAEQEAILLTWPDSDTDWSPWLNDVQSCYVNIINALNINNTCVVLLARYDQISVIRDKLPVASRVLLVPGDFNDTWVRDYGFLTCHHNNRNIPVDFTFNGWGKKFDSSKDNVVNRHHFAPLLQESMVHIDTVLEGGAIEINADGLLISTQSCLLNPERNGNMSLEEYDVLLTEVLGSSKNTFFENGHLQGDDTDGHIDTLVRFTPAGHLVMQSCVNRPDDDHFEGLQTLKEECTQGFPESKIFELPMPEIYSETGERLPASYANFLISNHCVFAPIYGEEEDQEALRILKLAYPNFTIVPIDAAPLIQQFGSLHCISMQVPKGTFKQDVLPEPNTGLTIYG